MGPILYEVAYIDGDYAQLKNLDAPDEPLKLVALALLPSGIMEGSKLKMEMFEYELLG